MNLKGHGIRLCSFLLKSRQFNKRMNQGEAKMNVFRPPILWSFISLSLLVFSACEPDDPIIVPVNMDEPQESDLFANPTLLFDAFISDSTEDFDLNSGEFGSPCEQGSDCNSGYCIELDSGRVCTELCLQDSDCENGLTCGILTNTGSDVTRLCIPDDPDLCEPCLNDDECDDPEDRCLQIGQSTYCAEDCTDKECPIGFVCETVPGEGTQSTRQCLPEGGLCAGCMDEDGDGYGVGGDCLGIDCDEEDPEVNEAGVESCDGRDNDCDFQVDEMLTVPQGVCLFDGACMDANPACLMGEWRCQYPDAVEDVSQQETRCDLIDNDCDGEVDEQIDFNSDINHCGFCMSVCLFDNAVPWCNSGVCEIERCQDGWVDLNQNPVDGCEHLCTFTSFDDEPDLDGLDQDCDGIDGQRNQAIFVDALSGDDLNEGSLNAPLASISAGIQKAQEVGLNQVYIGVGVYAEQVDLVPGIHLYGGYDAQEFWQRTDELATEVIFEDYALFADSIFEETQVQKIHFRSLDQFDDGKSSYGAIIKDSFGVILQGCVIEAGRGANGIDGRDGTAGTNGRRGIDGNDGQDGEFYDSCDRRVGGAGGELICDDGPVHGGQGGDGGVNNERGRDGINGTPLLNSDGIGGGGGNRSDDCDEASERGGTGNVGMSGGSLNGQDGIGGSGSGEIVGLEWGGNNGADGELGRSGGGGGGGGGSGGQQRSWNPFDFCPGGGCGSGGGGGGSGGCRGTPGTGGGGGGGSIGILLINASPFLDQNLIISHAGGDGGRGGTGGEGGAGGEGGLGGGRNGDLEAGGNGGRGGDGGRGGSGGGGGGGISVGVYQGRGSTPDLYRNRFQIGMGGRGGESFGFRGEPGASSEYL